MLLHISLYSVKRYSYNLLHTAEYYTHRCIPFHAVVTGITEDKYDTL